MLNSGMIEAKRRIDFAGKIYAGSSKQLVVV